jgi:hypothetical protein
MQWCVGIDESFLDQSITFWKKGDKLISIVLYATAVEQFINQMYQQILTSSSWKKSQISQLLKSVNADAKIGWMFSAFTKSEFPIPLGKRLRTVFSVRNAIVHFKGEAAHPDSETDSYSKIQHQLKGLRRMSISRDFRHLDSIFYKAVVSIDPHRDVTMRIIHSLKRFDKQMKGQQSPAAN